MWPLVNVAEEVQGRRSVERLAAEQIIPTENERHHHMLDTAAKLEKEHEQRLNAEAEKRVVQAMLEGEEGLKPKEEKARVASLGEEIHRLSLGTDGRL